ncbi:MAG TPA: hypothetical protein VKR54_03130 [Candidatus Babeliales bacterium]|nr:hypothetical protein [Candidatus Babeliales bacterium]
MNNSNGTLAILNKKNIDEVYGQLQTFLPIDFMQKTAACGSGEVKNTLQKTCWFYKNSFSKNNHLFVSNESFTAHEQDVSSMMCSAIWFNNVLLKNALNKYGNVCCISFTTQRDDFPFFLVSNVQYILAFGLEAVRNKYNNDEILSIKELELIFHVSLACNDIEAINNIFSRMKNITYNETDKCAQQMHMLRSIIQKDHTEIFELTVKRDPFNALNACEVFEYDLLEYRSTCLDILENSKDIPQNLKNKYIDLYRKHGGKTAQEMQKKEVCTIF